MKTMSDILGLILGLLGIVMAILNIIVAISKDPIKRIFKRLRLDPRIAWWLVAILLVVFGLFLLELFPTTTYPIEKASISTFPYEGGQYWSYLTVTSTMDRWDFSTRYELDYGLLADGDGYAGFDLRLSDPLDLSAYRDIELTINFGDDQAQFKLCIDDILGRFDCVTLGDGRIVAATDKIAQPISLRLNDYFPTVARSTIAEITIDVIMPPAGGDHSFVLSNMRFRK